MPGFSCSIEIVASGLDVVVTTDTDPMLTYSKVIQFSFSILTVYPIDDVKTQIIGDIEFGENFVFQKLADTNQRIGEVEIAVKENISTTNRRSGGLHDIPAGASFSRNHSNGAQFQSDSAEIIDTNLINYSPLCGRMPRRRRLF